MESQIKIRYLKEQGKTRFCQGDILKDVSFRDQINKDELEEIKLAYSVVISQDCDLEQDFNNRANALSKTQDKFITQILLLPAYFASDLKAGTHRMNISGEPWPSTPFGTIKSNNNPRFHFIEKDESLQVPELVIDFKHAFSVNRNKLYTELNDIYFATIGELYREDLAHRYCGFLSRIGLPNLD